MGDLFAFQYEITDRIPIARGIELTGREAAQPIRNPDALASWVADTVLSRKLRLDPRPAANALNERDQSAQSGGLVSAAWIIEA
jgi:hypothetical protein